MQTVELEQALNRAFQHHNAGQWQEAEALYRHILETVPDQPQTLHLLGLLCFQTGKREAAAKLLAKAVTILPENAEALFHLGVTLQALGRTDDAVAPYLRAVTLEPDNVEAHNNLGAVYEDLSRPDDAAASYLAALAAKPDYAGAALNLAALYRKHGRPDAAVPHYRAALKTHSDNAELHCGLGQALTALGQIDEALSSLRRAVELKPDYTLAHEKLGNALREQAQFEEACESYRAALAIDPDHLDARVNLGVTLQEMERFEDAAAQHRKALSIAPNFPSARHNLAHCHWKRSRYDEALEIFDSLDTPTADARALECLFAMQDFDRFYKRQQTESERWRGNLRTAAINAFAAQQLARNDPHPYCRHPLDFVRAYDALEAVSDAVGYLGQLTNLLEQQTAVWEPFGKSTVAGFQTPAVLFDDPTGPLETLRGLIEDHIARYREERFDEECDFIDRFPARYTLNAWYGKLVKGGHRLSHIHPSGWLSGVFYIQCPQGADPDEGAIEFSLHGYGYPVLDENHPRHRHRPKNGDLVLFPSSLFHGTVPIEMEEERLIVAFDLVPLAG